MMFVLIRCEYKKYSIL